MTHLRRLWRLWLVALILAGQSPARAAAETLDDWVSSERDAAARKLLAAIGRNGAVVASPDESTPSQDYYFHWVRDAALTMNVVVSFYENAPDGGARDAYAGMLGKYVAFSRKNQTAAQPAGFTGIGEPKFLVGGTVYTGSWGRPQNDGPALRSITLCRWANLLLDRNAGDPVVLNDIKPIVLDDLAYVRQHWPDKCTDLWEEVQGSHFYTRMVQRRSLLEGAQLLDRIGEMPVATACRAEVPPLEAAIANHFDQEKRYVVVTRDVDGDDKGKRTLLDVAVLLAALHGETPATPFFSPQDDKILATATRLRDKFAAQYPINGTSTDAEGQKMAPAIGRYPEDIYDGANDAGGNPWFLATAAFAEHSYRVRSAYQTAPAITISDLNLSFLTAARDAAGSTASLAIGDSIGPADPRFAAITSGLQVIGDRYLRRVRFHAADDGSLSEQFNATTGFMTSAVDLTWSYAALLTAIARR